MTFGQTMHTIESHLEALQSDYDRLLEENNQLKESILRKDKKINQLDTFFKLNQKKKRQ